MNDKIIVSKDNSVAILTQLVQDLITKIKNKDISLPYTTQLSKSTYLKIDGNGNMFLNNNGQYIDLGFINNDKLDINKIVDIFNIEYNLAEYWENTSVKNMITNVSAFGCVEYNGKIYCIGGRTTGETIVNTVLIYDISSNTWSTGTNCPIAKSHFGCIQYNGKIYCVGGYNGTTLGLNTVHVYDILNNTWSTITSMNNNRFGFGCIQYNGKIYCIGGYTSKYSYLTQCEIYNISTNTWSILSVGIPTARYGFGCVLHNDKIYCISGETNGAVLTNKVEIYDILSNIWSTGKDIPVAKDFMGCIIYNDNIYCIAGSNNNAGGSMYNTVYVYSILSGTWSVGTNIITARWCFGSIFYNNKIYTFGGTTVTNYINYSEILHLAFKSFNLDIPPDMYSKLNKIITNGTGNKILRNDGTYKAISIVYNNMSDQEISDSLSTIFANT